MGDDDEHVCTACGRQKQNHALNVRNDGVVTAASIVDPYGDWTVCDEATTKRLREWAEALEAWAENVLWIVKERRIPSADLIEDGDRISAEVRKALTPPA